MNSNFQKSIALIILPLFLSACSVRGDETDIPHSAMVRGYHVDSRSFDETVSLTGIVQSQHHTTLSSKTSGRVESVNFDIGDPVKKGDVIVRIAGDENAAAFQSAALNYQSALAQLSTTASLGNSQIRLAQDQAKTLQQRLTALRNSRDHTKQTGDQREALAIKQVESALSAYQSAQNETDQSFDNLDEQKRSLATQSVILSYESLRHLYSLFGINDDFEVNGISLGNAFGQRDAVQKNQTTQSIKRVIQSVQRLKSLYDTSLSGSELSDESAQDILTFAEPTIQELKDVYESVYDLLLNTVTSDSLSVTSLDESRQSVGLYGTRLETMLLSVQGEGLNGVRGIQQAEDTLTVQTTSRLSQAKNQLEVAREAMALTITQSRQELAQLDQQIMVLEQQLSETDSGVAIARSGLQAQSQSVRLQANQLKGQMEMAAVGLDNTQVVAPFDGIVVKRLIEKGAVVSPGLPLIEFADPHSLKITVSVSEDDFLMVSKNENGTVTFDHSSGVPVPLVLLKVAGHADPVTRKIPLEFGFKGGEQPLIGSFGRLTFIHRTPPVLWIPETALQHKNGQTFVALIQRDTAYLLTVSVGQRIADGFEIVNGLYSGNDIVLSGADRLQNDESLTVIYD